MSDYNPDDEPIYDVDPERGHDDFTEGEEVLLEIRDLAEQITPTLPQDGKILIAQRIVDMIDDYMGIVENM